MRLTAKSSNDFFSLKKCLRKKISLSCLFTNGIDTMKYMYVCTYYIRAVIHLRNENKCSDRSMEVKIQEIKTNRQTNRVG